MRSSNALLILAIAHVGGAAPSLDAQYLRSLTSTRCHTSPPTSFWQWIRSGVSKMPWIHTEGDLFKPARSLSYSPPKSAPIRQGDDLVLRFNITNDVEASGLRDAIDTLFLDVWEFADHWVDIRISESTVCWQPSNSMGATSSNNTSTDSTTTRHSPYITTPCLYTYHAKCRPGGRHCRLLPLWPNNTQVRYKPDK